MLLIDKKMDTKHDNWLFINLQLSEILNVMRAISSQLYLLINNRPNQNQFIFQAFLFRENSPGGLLFYLYLATFKSYIIMTLNNERKLGTYVPSAFLFGQQFRPGGTFSNQVGTSLCGGHNQPSLIGIGLMYLPKAKSLQRSLAMGDFYGTGTEIWAGFGPVRQLLRLVFSCFHGQKKS